MNKAILIGRLVADPDIRDGNTKIARYRLAVDRRKKNQEQTADFINCVAFGRNAEFVEKYLHKGTKILASGHIQTGRYTKQDGTTVYTTDVIVEEHEFVEPKAAEAPKPTFEQNDFMKLDDSLEDLPFH